MKKIYFRILNLVALVFGITLLLSSKMNITGAVVGVKDISFSLSSIWGVIFILVAVLLFVGGESLERILGFHDENDMEYQKLKKKLESKGERVVKKETIGHIGFETYWHFLEKRLYADFPTKMSGAYENDREEFFGRKKESDSDANKYLKERLNEINCDNKRVAEITAIIHNEGKKYDEEEVKRKRDELLEKYKTNKIDEDKFAKKLNNVGELTGGEYNPGNNHLSVKIMGHPIKIPNQGKNNDLAEAIHIQILRNSQSYKPDCEFHYSKKLSTKHHTKNL